MPTSSVVGRVAAVLALLGAIVVVLLLVLGGGSSYTVTAQFVNASQLVTGNNVNVAGAPVGSIKEISLSDDGQALVEMEIKDGAYTPLPEGTHATIRSQSLSGIANRYIDLDLPAQPDGKRISSGGAIAQADTTSEVDLDQLFNTLNKPTVDHLKQVIQGFAHSYDGVGAKANRGFHYLNPFLSTSRRVFGELNSDQARAREPDRRLRLADLGAGSARPRHLRAGREPERDDGGDRRARAPPSPPPWASCPTSCASSTPPRSTSAPPSTTSSRSSTPPGRSPKSSSPSPSDCAASPETRCRRQGPERDHQRARAPTTT